MKLLIIMIIVFLVVLYVYTFIKYKKRKRAQISSVDDYRRTYLKETGLPPASPQKDGCTNYLTKHNSSLDYIEKEAFISELTGEQESAKPMPRKFQF